MVHKLAAHLAGPVRLSLDGQLAVFAQLQLHHPSIWLGDLLGRGRRRSLWAWGPQAALLQHGTSF